MKYRVLLPAEYESSQRRYPVLYLLHGLGGDYRDWTTRSNLAEYSRTLPLIIVMPDGRNSWYTNALDTPADRFEDYILTDLQADVVRKYRTINSRYGRTIAGLSMGGYGALKMALKRPAAFSVAASFSDEMVERLHAKLGYPERCPHGWPVAPQQDREESRQLVSLADLEKGDTGEIVRLTEQDGGLLSWFAAEGLAPGAKVEVRDIQPAAGHRKIFIAGDGEQFIADRAARGLYVRRDGDA